MKINFNLLFYQKKLPKLSSCPVPIYLRFTVAGKRAEVSTGRVCEPGRWNVVAGRVSGTKEASKSLNRYLDNLQEQVYEAHCQLVEEGVVITAENLKSKLTGE